MISCCDHQSSESEAEAYFDTSRTAQIGIEIFRVSWGTIPRISHLLRRFTLMQLGGLCSGGSAGADA